MDHLTSLAKTHPVPYPKLLNWLESEKQRIYESDYTKQTLFYNFPLNIRVQMQFQGHKPCSELRPPVLERVADSLNIPPELQQLGHRAILTLEVGSLQMTFRLTWQPSLVWED